MSEAEALKLHQTCLCSCLLFKAGAGSPCRLGWPASAFKVLGLKACHHAWLQDWYIYKVKVSPCNPGWPRTHSILQPQRLGLGLTKV